jgi:hypothetical protein
MYRSPLHAIRCVSVDSLAALGVETCTDAQQLACNLGASYYVAVLPLVLEDHEFAAFADFLPAFNQKLCVQGSLSLAIELFESLSDAHGDVASSV